MSEEGKKVFIFNPFMAYPAWNVNGLMICGPVFEGGDVSTNRPDLVDMKTMQDIEEDKEWRKEDFVEPDDNV